MKYQHRPSFSTTAEGVWFGGMQAERTTSTLSGTVVSMTLLPSTREVSKQYKTNQTQPVGCYLVTVTCCKRYRYMLQTRSNYRHKLLFTGKPTLKNHTRSPPPPPLSLVGLTKLYNPFEPRSPYDPRSPLALTPLQNDTRHAGKNQHARLGTIPFEQVIETGA